tara:strand:+ start:5443 stop:7062 length:1620 start_codon:yes stop_codon:yes gene_type:complete
VTWPSGFAQSLYGTGTVQLALKLEVITPATGEGVAGSVPGWFATSNADADSFATILIRDGYRVNLGSAAIIPTSWQYVEGAWSFTIQIPEGRRRSGRLYGNLARQALRRGVMVRLSMANLEGTGGFAPLKLGRIYSVRSAGHPRTYKVEVWDIQTAFRSRMTATSVTGAQRAQLFYSTAGATDTLASPYATGAGDLTLTTSPADVFTFETGSAGVVRVTPNSGDSFLLKYTGVNVGAKKLTGLTSSGQFGTTAADADAGNTVSAACLIEGHPIDILLKILTSTGDGTNGDFDKYPRSWGLAVPIELISLSAFNQARRILQLASGNYHLRVLVEAEQADPSSFIAAILQPLGIWLCVRQGQIICRVGRDPNTAGIQRQIEDITERDLAEGPPVVEWYPTDQPQVFFRVVATRDDVPLAFSRSSISTLPVTEEKEYNLSSVLLSVGNASNIGADVSARLAPWAHLLPEYIDVTLAGIRSYAPGDVVTFSCSTAYGRFDGTKDGYQNRPVMVIRSAMNLNENATRLTLAALPTSLNEDGGGT